MFELNGLLAAIMNLIGLHIIEMFKLLVDQKGCGANLPDK